MTTIEQVRRHTNKVFDNLFIPTSDVWETKIGARSILTPDKSELIFNYRRWKAKQIGFKQIAFKDFLKLLMGSEPTHDHKDTKRPATKYEWLLNHHTKKDERKRWTRPVTYYERWESQGLIALPPFSSKLVWQVKFCKLNDLDVEVPMHVMLKVLELKTLGIFNCFHVAQPVQPSLVPPCLLASMFELPPDTEFWGGKKRLKLKDSKYQFSTSGKVAHYYVCDWKE